MVMMPVMQGAAVPEAAALLRPPPPACELSPAIHRLVTLVQSLRQGGSAILHLQPCLCRAKLRRKARIHRAAARSSSRGALSDDDSQSDDEPACRPATIKWGVPDGFAVAKAPAKIDGSSVGRFIFLNWKDYGWSLGMVKDLVTAATPRLYKQYNVRVIWAVEGKLNRSSHGPCKLDLKAYASGPEAPLDSWVFLDKMEAQH